MDKANITTIAMLAPAQLLYPHWHSARRLSCACQSMLEISVVATVERRAYRTHYSLVSVHFSVPVITRRPAADHACGCASEAHPSVHHGPLGICTAHFRLVLNKTRMLHLTAVALELPRQVLRSCLLQRYTISKEIVEE